MARGSFFERGTAYFYIYCWCALGALSENCHVPCNKGDANRRGACGRYRLDVPGLSSGVLEFTWNSVPVHQRRMSGCSECICRSARGSPCAVATNKHPKHSMPDVRRHFCCGSQRLRSKTEGKTRDMAVFVFCFVVHGTHPFPKPYFCKLRLVFTFIVARQNFYCQGFCFIFHFFVSSHKL